jgi:hypothetical protein
VLVTRHSVRKFVFKNNFRRICNYFSESCNY